MSPWSTSRATPSLGSSPCPRRPRSIVPSITGSGGASRRCSPTSSPGASGWKTASSATQSGWGACSSSWRWPCIGPCPRACGTPRIGLCPPKKSLNAKAEKGGPRPNFPLQARPAPHPTSPSAPDPAPAPLERLAELMDGKAAGPAPVAADSLSCYIVAPAPERPLADLTPINLRDANQQFSELVRRVEATGEGYLVLRHGRPVARLLPASETPRRLTPEQEGALARLLSTSWPLGVGRLDREEAYDERLGRVGPGGGGAGGGAHR